MRWELELYTSDYLMLLWFMVIITYFYILQTALLR